MCRELEYTKESLIKFRDEKEQREKAEMEAAAGVGEGFGGFGGLWRRRRRRRQKGRRERGKLHVFICISLLHTYSLIAIIDSIIHVHVYHLLVKESEIIFISISTKINY